MQEGSQKSKFLKIAEDVSRAIKNRYLKGEVRVFGTCGSTVHFKDKWQKYDLSY